MAHVEIILDRSGSMQSVREETVTGINAFVKEQPKGTTFTLTQFDLYQASPSIEKSFERKKKSDAKLAMDGYHPRGSTPLLDAVGSVMSELYRDPPKDDRVVVLIVTDGYENSSREYDKAKVRALIEQAKTRGWQIVFMGADIDAYGEAGGLGIGRDQTMAYASVNTGMAYGSMARSVSDYTSGESDTVTAEDVK